MRALFEIKRLKGKIQKIVSQILVVAALQISVVAPTLAVPPGASCGGTAGIKCDAGLWCDPLADKCSVHEAAGKCVDVARLCTLELRLVCGCNGKTYNHDCDRQIAKVAKRSEGACVLRESPRGQY
jgi:hypothetical protein